MLDWLKFFPYANQTTRSHTEVRGPYFPNPKPRRWKLGDSLLRFKAPRSNPIFGFSSNGRSINRLSPGPRNILKAEWEPVYGGNSDAPPSEWLFHHFYSDEWLFVGPWFSGFQARLTGTGLLVTPDTRIKSSFSDKNLFHPKVFESAIANYLDHRYGYYRNGRKPRYRGPLNWRVLPISKSIQAVICDIHQIGNSSIDNPLLLRLVFFPVTPQTFIYITFSFGGTEIYNNKVCAEPMFKLCDSIINSFHLDVGAKTQAEWEKVKATCPDMSITDSFGELPWPLKKETKSKNPKEVDITPASDPVVIEYDKSSSR
ncbi:hypothetical protein [Teredinibacter turnerae]|uniref:hypothetical protein n=1 Tax=Teredinibacter turnerae TaxID=2426 RepID=UPI000423185A|nr:hypothetical protein [Teredinibacter turnerae]